MTLSRRMGRHRRHRQRNAQGTSIRDEQGSDSMGHRFDLVWRGLDRYQVNEYLSLQLRWLVADRDAAVAMAGNHAKLLDECRLATRRLREQLDRLCQTPLSPDAVDVRLRRQVEIARAEASATVTSARARAEHIRATADEEAVRLAASAEQRRKRIEDDFEIAMTARHAEVMRRLRDYEAACRAQAEQLIHDARPGATGHPATPGSHAGSLPGAQ